MDDIACIQVNCSSYVIARQQQLLQAAAAAPAAAASRWFPMIFERTSQWFIRHGKPAELFQKILNNTFFILVHCNPFISRPDVGPTHRRQSPSTFPRLTSNAMYSSKPTAIHGTMKRLWMQDTGTKHAPEPLWCDSSEPHADACTAHTHAHD